MSVFEVTGCCALSYALQDKYKKIHRGETGIKVVVWRTKSVALLQCLWPPLKSFHDWKGRSWSILN